LILAVLLAQILAPCSPALDALRAEHVRGAELLARGAVCADVVVTAHSHGVDPRMAVAVAFYESRMRRGAESGVGAVGPMQVIPRYWCPGGRAEGCDLVAAGMRALAEYTTRYGTEEGLARYNAGNRPGPRAWEYARRVLRWEML